MDFGGITAFTLCCSKLTKFFAFVAQACLSAGRGVMVQKGPIDLGGNSDCTHSTRQQVLDTLLIIITESIVSGGQGGVKRGRGKKASLTNKCLLDDRLYTQGSKSSKIFINLSPDFCS